MFENLLLFVMAVWFLSALTLPSTFLAFCLTTSSLCRCLPVARVLWATCLTCFRKGGEWILECGWPALRFVFLSGVRMQISWEDAWTWSVGRGFVVVLFMWRFNETICVTSSYQMLVTMFMMRLASMTGKRGKLGRKLQVESVARLLFARSQGCVTFAFVGPLSMGNIKNYMTTWLYKEE